MNNLNHLSVLVVKRNLLVLNNLARFSFIYLDGQSFSSVRVTHGSR